MTAQPRTVPFATARKLPPFLEGLQYRQDLLGPCAGVFLLTPDVARRWCTEHNADNRPFYAPWSQSITNAIIRGEWKLNGEAIVFENQGGAWKLINGQHRSMAVANSGMAVWVWVIWGEGVEAGSFSTFDLNRRRSGSDALAIQKMPNYANLSAALTNHYQYRVGRFNGSSGLLTPTLVLNELEAFPGMVDSVSWVCSLGKKSAVVRPSHASVLHFVAKGNFQEEVEDFLTCLNTGANIEPDSALMRLQQRLLDNLKAKAKLSRVYLFALLIKAWNLHITGQSVRFLKWLEGTEEFPKIVDA